LTVPVLSSRGERFVKAAVLHAFGSPPRYEEFPEPTPGPGEVLLHVRASALTRLAYGIASGGHYAASPSLPCVVGIDGVGTTADGARVYASGPRAPYGMMAERTVVPATRCQAVPDGIDDLRAAALPNAALGPWLALEFRARLAAGESVLVLGATGITGRMAIPIARHLGAARVVAAGRNETILAALAARGADATISLRGPDDTVRAAIAREVGAHPVDVVLDFLWGRPAELTISALLGHGGVDAARPIRFVSAGQMAGATAAIPSAALRSSGLLLVGSGIGSVPFPDVARTYPRIWALASAGGLSVDAVGVPLAEVESAWSAEAPDGRRRVFVP
jgi:NADPH:quinone reductase-like Zn-dependent oxidoreductase